MAINRLLTFLFLGLIIATSFLVISIHVINVQFCVLPMTHPNSFCDVVRDLSKHNFFGTAMAEFLIFISALFLFFGKIDFLNNRTPISRERALRNIPRPLLSFLFWIKLHLNSPNVKLVVSSV